MLEFVPALGDHADAVDRFNERMRAGGRQEEYAVRRGVFANFEGSGQNGIDQEKYLFLDGSGEMRAGYYLKHQIFQIGSEFLDIGNVSDVICESVVNRRYAPLPVAIIDDALRRMPEAFSLGGGNLSEPYMKLLHGLKWNQHVVPFFFRVFKPYRFCRRMSHIRQTAARRALLDVAAFTGLASLGINLVHGVKSRRPDMRGYSVQEVDHFDAWADSFWEEARPHYPFVAVRTHSFLNFIHRRKASRRLVIKNNNGPVGWTVCLVTDFADNRHFGSLRVGSVIDVFALPGMEAVVVNAATDFLRDQQTDIAVSNQLHRSWQTAFQRLGYLQGPSNVILSRSPKLTERCQSLGIAPEDIHMTRSDGEGPIGLVQR